MEIILACDNSSHGQYQYVKVPWAAIFSGAVKYGLAEFYSVSGQPSHVNTLPFKTLLTDSLVSKNEIGHKTVSNKRISASKNQISIQSATKSIT